MHLLTAVSEVDDPARSIEFIRCLNGNVACEAISTITVFYQRKEHDGPVRSVCEQHKDKIKLVLCQTRPTFMEMFAHARFEFGDDLAIIANGDILFSSDSRLDLAERNLKRGASELWCVTRYAPTSSGDWQIERHPWIPSFYRYQSQDTWIFRSSLKPFDSNILIGTNGCDSLLMYRAVQAGIRVKNPAFDVRTFHVHDEQCRIRSGNWYAASYHSASDYRHFRIRIGRSEDRALGRMSAWASYSQIAISEKVHRFFRRRSSRKPVLTTKENQ